MTINLDIKHANIDTTSFYEELEEIRKAEVPSFVTHDAPVDEIKKQVAKYQKFKNILIFANGGSRTSSLGIYEALAKFKINKNIEFVTTMEPDYLNSLKKKYSKEDTLIMVITKSGTNVCPLEGMFYFWDYQILPVTSDDRGVLKEICDIMDIESIVHPNIGGRYSGLTSCGVAPSLLMGVDVEKVIKGAKEMYQKCAPNISINKNPALELAACLYGLDKKGYNEIFLPVYSTKLAGFIPLIVQLMHESVCKEQKGQTIFGDVAPESQHHTNQRFFGGKKDVIGLFVVIDEQDDQNEMVQIPDEIKNLKLRDGVLGDLGDVDYSKCLEFEFKGTFTDAVNNKIPSIVLSVDKINETSIGEYIAFWQYVAVYSSLLRNVNPYDQPQVESSKNISFELRKKYKK